MKIQDWLEYDAWATAALLDSVTTLSPEQFVQEFGSSLTSIRQQFVHLLSVADRYRARLAQEAVPDVVAESIMTPRELVIYEAEMRGRLRTYMRQLRPEELSRVVDHETRRGVYRASVGETLQHMVNHATYHRGQVAALLKQHGVDFSDTDLIIWLNRMEDMK